MVVLWWCCGRARCFEVQKGCVFKKGFWKCGSRSVFESCTFYLHDGRANRGCRCTMMLRLHGCTAAVPPVLTYRCNSFPMCRRSQWRRPRRHRMHPCTMLKIETGQGLSSSTVHATTGAGTCNAAVQAVARAHQQVPYGTCIPGT